MGKLLFHLCICNCNIDLVSLIISILGLMLATVLSYLALKFTAKPNIKVIPISDEGSRVIDNNTIEVVKGKNANLRFRLRNIGHGYANPAATNCTFYVNFPPEIIPVEIHFGSNLEKSTKYNDERGKANSRVLRATGIHLFYGEPDNYGEDILVVINVPDLSNIYKMWITRMSDNGDYGVNKFNLKIVDS